MKTMQLSGYVLILLTALLLVFWGCSEPTDEGIRNPHPSGWLNEDSPNFHAENITDLSVCTECHGADFQGGNAGVSCYDCHEYPHPQGWANPTSHGEVVISFGFAVDACEGCHLSETSSGDSTWYCWSCHAYFPHTDAIEDYKHGGVFPEINYQVWLCQNCHGEDYSGGIAQKTCLDCHAYSPESCNTCHGIFGASPNDTITWAPPPDLLGQNDPSVVPVGAHAHHVNPTAVNSPYIGGPYSCSECHILPTAVDAPSHLDTLTAQAELVFGQIATNFGGVQPSWSHDDATCSGVYCHGNFELGHPDNTALWINQDGTQIQCGICHGMPPQPPHSDDDECYECHASVVNQNNEIIAPNLHVNGHVNF